MHEELAFVVVGSAGVDGAVADDWLEWVGFPEFEGFHRLDVIVTIDQDCR